MMQTFFFILGLVLILTIGGMFVFSPAAVEWFLHHRILDGFLDLMVIVFHWFNTYSPKQQFVPRV